MFRLVCFVAVTAGLALAPLAGRAAEAVPEVRDYAGVAYVSGGVGLEERAQLEALGTEFSLRLTFALTTRSFLSDVPVRVLDSGGRVVLEATSDGPILFARLDPGAYVVEAGPPDELQRRSVQVVAGRQIEVNFFWRPLDHGGEPDPVPRPEETGGRGR
jgi:hypothetical protein